MALVLGVPFGIILLAWLVKKRQGKDISIDRGLALLFFGAVITWLGAFPYLAVGLWPSFGDFQSRHQLLMPLGAAVAIVGAGSWISHGNVFLLNTFLFDNL